MHKYQNEIDEEIIDLAEEIRGDDEIGGHHVADSKGSLEAVAGLRKISAVKKSLNFQPLSKKWQT